MSENKTPHKHAELIKAWADGADIEYLNDDTNVWTPTIKPVWNSCTEYRIKLKKKVKKWRWVAQDIRVPTLFVITSGHWQNEEEYKFKGRASRMYTLVQKVDLTEIEVEGDDD